MIYELMISNYPNSYWFQYDSTVVASYEFIEFKEIQLNKPLVFKLEKKLVKNVYYLMIFISVMVLNLSRLDLQIYFQTIKIFYMMFS